MSQIKEMDKNNLIKRNLDKPPIKDTVTVPVGGKYLLKYIHFIILIFFIFLLNYLLIVQLTN